MWTVQGQAAKRRAAGLALAIRVRGDGQRKKGPTDPGFQGNRAPFHILMTARLQFKDVQEKMMEVRAESCVLVRLEGP